MACKAKVYGAAQHPPEVIAQDENNRFVSDTQIQQWTNGTAGQGQFMSMVFQRSATVPATPTGGNWNFPIPDGGLWTNTILPGLDPVFISTRFFTSDGQSPQENVWRPPVLFVQNGWPGDKGEKGDKGEPGLHGNNGINGLNGIQGIPGYDGTGVVWLGEAASHPLDPENGDAYRNTTDNKTYIYWDGVWHVMTIDGPRGSNTFTIDESDINTPHITAAVAASWAGSLDHASASAVARDIILYLADDHSLRPNDKITITDKNNQLAGTRVYTGLPTDDYTLVDAFDFSSLVTEVIHGSLVVQGTVSADRFAADIIAGGVLLGGQLVIGYQGIGGDKPPANANNTKVALESTITEITSGGLKLRNTANDNHVQITPGTLVYQRGDNGVKTFEVDNGVFILRDPTGGVLLQSGGNLSYTRVTGGPPSNADNTSLNTAYNTERVGGDVASQVVRINNKINSSNQATYISSLVVPEAWIGNLAVTRAKIADLAVGTIQIGDNAVTIPVTATGSTSASLNYVATTAPYEKVILIAQTTIASSLIWFGQGDGSYQEEGFSSSIYLKMGTTPLAEQHIYQPGSGSFIVTLVAFYTPASNTTYTFSITGGGSSSKISAFGAKK